MSRDNVFGLGQYKKTSKSLSELGRSDTAISRSFVMTWYGVLHPDDSHSANSALVMSSILPTNARYSRSNDRIQFSTATVLLDVVSAVAGRVFCDVS